jgi:hypothetical protein
MLEVVVVPNQRRPGVGQLPQSEARRAWLPQQARFCPVLEDGSKIGYLVYPPLAMDESLQVRFVDEGYFRFTFYKREQPVFTLLTKPAAGGGLTGTDELLQFDADAGLPREAIPTLIDALTVNIGGLAGGVGLRGAYDFVTPDGWDTIYTSVLNSVERPHVPGLTVRVETDWFRQPTEFRYALQNGEAISASGFAPVGQVFFVPREPVALRTASDEERARYIDELNAYWGRKPELRQHTPYGGVFDHQYRQESRVYEAEHTSSRPPYEPSSEALARFEDVAAPSHAPHPSDPEVRARLASTRRRRKRK